jgi:NADP-dependent 3-hydroxy acid dehydrogenase YdfG
MTYEFQPQSLADKAVVISGGTAGIGRTVGVRLAMEGAKILIFGRHEQQLQDALRDIKAVGKGQVFGMIADQAKWEDVERVFQEADAKLGGVDILINNASIAAESIAEAEHTDWEYTIQSNLLGYMACSRQAINRMKAKGGGHIVNIGSMSAKERGKGSDIYVATKAGTEGFSEALGKQVAEQNIKVSLVEPGLVGTEMTEEKVPREEQTEKQAEGTMLRTEDIAECVYYILMQPQRCNILQVRIQPLNEGE